MLASPVPLVPIAIDRPDHKKYRRVLDPMFAPKVIDAMQDELREQVKVLIDAFKNTGRCDVVADLARLYPTQVFLTLTGMPLADRDQFIEWEELIVENSQADASGSPRPEVAKAGLELFTYLQSFLADKRAASEGEDLLSKIIRLEGEEAWSDEEILGLCFLFILAGLDTVSAAIGFLFLHLCRNPELRQKLVADPSLIPAFIEEVLRLELPAPMTPRVTTEDVEVCGTLIPGNSTVYLCLATINRDPELFDTPDEINLNQTDQAHYTFGGGIHRCLGSHLARRELLLVVEEFLKAIPEFELAGDEEPEICWPSGTLHLKTLPIRF